MKKVVVIGGGTGTYTVLRGIKNIKEIDITAIVTSADSGGSSGVLRDEFGQLPVGDFRQCLVALARDESEDDNLLRELFQYRFEKGGKGLEGHNFGNLFLTALKEILGSEELALRKASKILNIQGRVFPITVDNVELIAEYEDGTIGYGEAMIDEPPKGHNGELRIKKLWTQPRGVLMEKSKLALESADFIILGPGDLYSSILANIVVDDVAKVIKSSKAKIIFIPNLVTKYGQTFGFGTKDFIDEIEKYIGRHVDYVLVNITKVPRSILARYRLEKAYAVKDTLGDDDRVIRSDLISSLLVKRKKKDLFKRSLIRHDSDKIRKQVELIIKDDK